MNKTALGFIAATLVVIVGGWLLLRERGPAASGAALTVYCAAGLRPPVEAAAKDYEKEFGARINLQYGGSNTLLAQIDSARTGDLYLAADHGYLSQAEEKGLIDETLAIGSQRPVIGVRQGNPKNVRALDDLKRPDVRVALCAESAAVGKASKAILEKAGLWKEVWGRKVAEFPTVPELANALKLDAADAAIVWDATVRQTRGLDMVALSNDLATSNAIEIAVLRFAKDPTQALRFARYLTARDRGLVQFAKQGYQVIQGDPWADRPRLIVFSGGVLRPAVEKTIQEFAAREGVQIDTQFNGCGILLGSMKAGMWPDGFLACDVSFLRPVQSKFENVVDLSSTRILIAVPKGNPKGIHALEDLARPGLKVGLANEEKSTLGALTRRILEQKGLYDRIRPNAVADAATADLLVNDLMVGALDATIVYYANVARHLDKIDIVEIEGVNAVAVQPAARLKDTKFPNLTQRLLDRIEDTQAVFEANGFNWIGRSE
ncbi:MAG: molybdate ABC transporter substrate-binding protein [Candidatus Sumerlaeota bacterium]|nr:molybdate ABC transporter substrate-binding protein [Candidatus Sumerlaeota bacterium]